MSSRSSSAAGASEQEPVLQKDGLAIDSQLGLASGVIRILGQVAQCFKEIFRLPDKESIVGESLNCPHCGALCIRGPNNRTRLELAAEEWAGLGHDQVALQGFRRVAGEFPEMHLRSGHRIYVGQSQHIAGLVHPSLKVSGLGGPDAKQNAQDFDMGDPLCQRRIEAAAALLNGAEMESGGEGNRLEVVGDVEGGDVGRAGRSSSVLGIAVRFTIFSAWPNMKLGSRSGLWLSLR